MGIEDSNLDNANQLLEEIERTETLNPSEISLDLYNLRTNKSEKLINNTNPAEYQKGKNYPYRFSFTEKLWISTITIKTGNYSSSDKIDFTYLIDNKIHELKASFHNDCFVVSINDFIDGFTFKPPKKWLVDPRLISISADGFTIGEFTDTCKTLSRIEKHKYEIVEGARSVIEKAEASKNSIDDLTIQIEEKEALLSELNDNLSQSTATKTELNEVLRSLGTQESDVRTRIESLEDSIDGKRNEQKSLNSDIELKKSEFKKLEDDINMFPSEIAGFVNEGEKALRKYYWLAAIPMVVIILVTFSLFSSAVDLTTILKANDNIDILTVMLTRLPYVAVSGTLIAACYQLIKYFVGQMVKINQQRLNLNKISIIANDVSIASSVGIELDESDKYHARTKLKMELLKEHLKEEISQNYEYDENYNIHKNSNIESETLETD